MAITELKKIAKKEIQTRCKALRALGVARVCFGIFWQLLDIVLVSFGYCSDEV